MTGHSAIVQGMAAGVGGAMLALLGVDAPTLTAALFGCALGAAFAPPTTRIKACLLFLAAVAASAISASVLGPLLAGWLPGVSAAIWAEGAALGVGIFLHPLIQAGSVAVPRLVGAALSRIDRSAP